MALVLMNSVLFVAAVGLFILSIAIFIYSDKKEKFVGFIPLIGAIIFTIVGITEPIIEQKMQPSALDVYRGKTTLQITYQDSIPVDTIVIFKEEYKK